MTLVLNNPHKNRAHMSYRQRLQDRKDDIRHHLKLLTTSLHHFQMQFQLKNIDPIIIGVRGDSECANNMLTGLQFNSILWIRTINQPLEEDKATIDLISIGRFPEKDSIWLQDTLELYSVFLDLMRYVNAGKGVHSPKIRQGLIPESDLTLAMKTIADNYGDKHG